MKNIKFKEGLFCLCGKFYELKDIYILIKNLFRFKINSNEILNFYLQKNNDKCCICLRNFKIKLFEFKKSDINLSINKEFIHYFYKECMNKIEIQNLYVIHCNLCDINQKIKEIINT